jgi:tetratricopeptide (TPR) repeat protein
MDVQGELETLHQKSLELRALGRQAEADMVEQKAAGILQGLKDRAEQKPDDPSTAAILLYLAEREWAILGDHEQVLLRLEQALALREKSGGPNHLMTAEALAKLAEFHFLAGRFGKAEPLYRRALSIYSIQNAPGDAVEAQALAGLAQTLEALGRAEEADGYFEKAIERAPTNEQGRRSLYFLMNARAAGLEKLNRGSEAEAHRQKAAGLLPKANPGESGYHA